MGLAIFEGAANDHDDVGAALMGSGSPDGRGERVAPLARGVRGAPRALRRERRLVLRT